MSNKKTKIKSENQELTVNTSTFRGSQYSQIVGITISSLEATLEFVYVSPSIKTKGEVVSRITLPISVVKSLADKINNTITLYEQKIAKKN
jgi:hypothetical protein